MLVRGLLVNPNSPNWHEHFMAGSKAELLFRSGS